MLLESVYVMFVISMSATVLDISSDEEWVPVEQRCLREQEAH